MASEVLILAQDTSLSTPGVAGGVGVESDQDTASAVFTDETAVEKKGIL